MIRSMHTDQSNHDPAQLLLSCGSPLFGNPSMGAWLNYGLGSEYENLPGYVVLLSNSGKGVDAGQLCGAVAFAIQLSRRNFPQQRRPILHLANPPGVSKRHSFSGCKRLRNSIKNACNKSVTMRSPPALQL